MMQKLGNRRSVQKCAQKAGSYVLKIEIGLETGSGEEVENVKSLLTDGSMDG